MPQFEKTFLSAMASDLSENGRNLVGAVTAWKLSKQLGEAERYSVLRTAVWDSVAAHEKDVTSAGETGRDPALVTSMVDRVARRRGSVETFRQLLLLDAGQSATEISGDPQVENRVNALLERSLSAEAGCVPQTPRNGAAELKPYRLARDYGQLLESAAIRRRFSSRFPGIEFTSIVDASADNLANASSFEEWSFA